MRDRLGKIGEVGRSHRLIATYPYDACPLEKSKRVELPVDWLEVQRCDRIGEIESDVFNEIADERECQVQIVGACCATMGDALPDLVRQPSQRYARWRVGPDGDEATAFAFCGLPDAFRHEFVAPNRQSRVKRTSAHRRGFFRTASAPLMMRRRR